MQTKIGKLLAGGALASILATTVATAQQYPTAVLSKAPIGYWRLNETGTVLPSPLATNIGSVGSAGDGTYIEASQGVTGIPGASGNAAVNFPGIIDGNRVRVPFNSAWNRTGPYTVEFWAKPGQTASLTCPASSVEFIATPTQRNGWLIYQSNVGSGNGNGWLFRQYNSSGLSAATTAEVSMALDVNSWYHVVGVFDGIDVKLYVNGVNVTNKTITGTARANTNSAIPLTFGARADGASGYFSYNGTVDESAVYTNALSASQILTHYQAGTNASTANYSTVVLADGPSGYWRLADGSSVLASNSGTKGAGANASYVFNAQPGASGSGPTPSSTPTPFGGFEATNKAPTFDGVSGTQIAIPPLRLTNNSVTMAAWIKPNGLQVKDAGIVISRGGNTSAGLKIGNTAGLELGYDWNNSAENFVTFLNIPDAQWSFVALAVDPNKAVVFLYDGTTFQTVTNVGVNLNQDFAGKTLIGQYTGATTNANFIGQIDEVSIFNKTLSVGDVYSLCSAAIGTNPPVVFTDLAAPSPIYATEPLNLAVDAGGTPPLGYQWITPAGTPIGANTNTYYIASLLTSYTGTYKVVITNLYGSATSEVYVSVSPVDPVVITQDPVGRSVYVGGSVTLSNVATGGALRYQWTHAGTNIPGATAASYKISSAATKDDGIYTVIVTNAYPSAQTSGVATVTVLVPTPGTYPAAIVADAPEAYWKLDDAGAVMTDSMGRHDGTYDGVTLGVPGVVTTGGPNLAASFPGTGGSSGLARVPYSPLLNQVTYSVEAWVKTPDSTSRQVALSSTSINSSSSPYNGRGYALEASAFSDALWYAAYGRNNQYVNTVVPLGPVVPNQWTHLVMTYSPSTGQVFYYNGVRVPAGTGGYADFTRNSTADFLLGALLPGTGVEEYFTGLVDEAAYYPTNLSQAQVQAHYQAALYGTTTGPVFTLQPQSQAVALGSTVAFTATVGGSTPIYLQWLKNGAPLASQTNTTLTLNNVYYTAAGNYQLKATNSVNSATSQVAVLTVWPTPPVFANLTNALVMHLKFDGNLLDSTGRGNNGTNVGATTLVPGKLGSALSYNTDTTAPAYNYVTLGVRPDLQFSSNVNFSVAYWVKLPPGSTNGDLPFFCNDAGSLGNPGYTFAPGYKSGTWALSLGAVRLGDFETINDGQWHSLVHVVQRTGDVATYLDGVLSDLVYGGGIFDLDTGQPTNIGQDNTGTYPETGSAILDDFGVWRRALTEYEAEAIYQVGNLGKSFDSYGPVTLTIRQSGSIIELIWAAGTLLQSNDIAAPAASWTPVPGATAPYLQVTPGPGAMFYRVRL